MPAVNLPPMTADHLEEAAQTLSPADFDALVDRLITLRARRRVAALSDRETDLLKRISAAVPLNLRQQRQTLYDLSQTRRLTDDERAEFLRLTNAIENAEAARIPLLGKLAALRGVSLPEIARQLGLNPT
jgi:hypothetical protein